LNVGNCLGEAALTSAAKFSIDWRRRDFDAHNPRHLLGRVAVTAGIGAIVGTVV
jgi:hypothetical protein